MKKHLFLIVAIVLTGSQSFADEKPYSERKMHIISQITWLKDTYSNHIRYVSYRQERKPGDEARLACADIVFLQWSDLYSKSLLTLSPDDRDEYYIGEFNEFSELVKRDVVEIFDEFRPGLSSAIGDVLPKFQHEVPESLTAEDSQFGLLDKNLMICEDQVLLKEVNSRVPPL